MKWVLLAAAAAIVALIAIVVFSGFADVPCQDGHWDPVKQTCVPY